jgi:hypothetical protein
VQVQAQVSGVIIARHFQDGSDVKKVIRFSQSTRAHFKPLSTRQKRKLR